MSIAARPLPLRRILSVLFFFSGMPALVYQLAWQRALFRIFGVNIESVTIVVTAFMLGLGLGSLAGGWLSTRRRLQLLPLLAAIEFAIGIFGIFSLRLFDAVGDLVLGWPIAAMAAVALALVAIPTLLMGATLPVLVGHLVRRNESVGESVGTLYYANTLGAGAACLVAAVLLFPFLGLQRSVYAAAAMNVAVAMGALVAYAATRRARGAAAPATDERTMTQDPSAPRRNFSAAIALSFLGGFVALSYEIFFFRVVSFMTGSRGITFAATLGVFLVGLAGGAREGGKLSRKDSDESPSAGHVLRLVALANLGALLLLPILTHARFLGRGMVGVAIFLAYFVGRNWGVLLPYLAHRGIAADASSGAKLSYLYLANILGCALGSTLTGFVLMNLFGMRALAMILAAAGLGFALVASRALASRDRPVRVPAAILAIVAVMLASHWPLTDGAIEALQWHEEYWHGRFVQIFENRSGVVTVDSLGEVFGHGMYDGQLNIDLRRDTNAVWRAYALELYHPAPREVLIIGLSSGSWAQVIANAPGVERVTIVEINPAYSSLIRTQPAIASLLSNPKVEIAIDDGRRWLRAHPGRLFDAVVANTAIHYRDNASNVLSVEFQELVKRHLKPGGTLFYNTTFSTRAMRTGCTAFRHGYRLEHFMVVSDEPVDLSTERWRETLLTWRIDGRPVLDLSRTDDQQVLGRLLAIPSDREQTEPCASVLARTSGQMPITDDNMGTEWRHPLGLDRDSGQ